ncbi:hypothetical protein G5I_01486 [Acromyrmex echinatior]|uniref:Uncharacterized protein n=1 Tax=Acromyrmex echinatior TaxID=103372 RepID=F4W7R3_ACREC|nr:hypothetical protein G5I_01486 [Acromyrmex echinatior]
MVGVCETQAEPSDNGLTELKRGTGQAPQKLACAAATALPTFSADDGSPSTSHLPETYPISWGQLTAEGSLGPPTIVSPQSTGEQFSEISYSSTLETQPLDLTFPPVIDLVIREILNYSHPLLEE